MKLPALILTSILLLCVSVGAQKIEKPKLTPKPSTPQQSQLIREGIALHDKKDFQGAIAKYKQVLAENPDNTFAIYELSLSVYSSGDKKQALALAFQGATYDSDELPLFYQTIANVKDDEGKPAEAIKVYKDALRIVKDRPNSGRMRSSLQFNMGITYFRQKNYTEARTVLKEAVESDPTYASPNYVLSELFFGTRYKVPAFLAAGRFIVLEPDTQRTARASTIIKEILGAAKKDEKTGNVNITLDLFAPTDEGEFGMYELLLGTLMAVEDKEDKGKTHEERFAEAVDSVIAMLTEDDKLKKTFVGKYYLPFFSEMKKQGHVPAFAHLALARAGGSPEAEKWISSNGVKVQSLLGWAKGFR